MDYLDYIFLIGRVLFGGFFLISGIDHFRNSQGLIQYAKSKGVPAAKFSVILTGIVLIFGGISVILGFYPMYGAILIGLFLLLAAFKVHSFWKVTDPQARSNDRTGFTKNIALLGGALILMSIPTPWTMSVPMNNSSAANKNGEAVMNKESEGMTSSETKGGDGAMTGSAGALGVGESFSAPSVASITVFNQKAADTANVSLVSSDSSAWLAVREDSAGLVGNILGAKRIDIGTTANVVIPLQRGTEADRIYHVVLFKDNDDKVFDFKVDPPMTENNALISKTFLTF